MKYQPSIKKFETFIGTWGHRYSGLILTSGISLSGYMVYGDIFLNTPELEILSQLYIEEEVEIDRLRDYYCDMTTDGLPNHFSPHGNLCFIEDILENSIEKSI